MIRAALLLVSAFCLAACGPDSTPTDEGKTKSSQSQPETAPKVGNAPVTGSPMFRKDTDAIARDVEELTKRARPTDADKLAAFEGEVRMKIRHIDITLEALAVSITAESKSIAEASHASMLKKRQEIDKEIDGKWREITEIRDLLKTAAKGSDAIPPGFTEDELKDRLADMEGQVRTLRGKRTELNTDLQKVIDQLASGQPLPESGTTTLTQERDLLLELKARAEKLLKD